MASWKKIIVSGSKADLNEVTASGGIITAGDLTVSGGDITLGTTSIFSGGNTTSLNNIDAIDATTEATIEAALDTLSNVTTVGTLNAGAISSGFGNIDNGTSTLNTGNATVDNLTNASEVADSHITGSFTGSYAGDGSNLTGIALDIDGLSALGGTGIAQSDKLVFSDAGTEKSITFSNFEDAIFGNVSGDVTIAAGGAATLANNSVSQAQLDDDAVGADELAANAVVNASIASSAAIDMDKLDGDSLASSLTDFAQDDLVILSDTSDSGNLKSMTTSNLEDAIFGNVSGEATIAAGGALTIAANTIGNNELKQDDDITLQSLTVTNNLVVNGTQTILNTANLVVEDKFILLNSGSNSGDGGIIVQTETAFSGSAFVFDDSEARWGFQIGTKLGDTATAAAPDAYASAVVTSDDSNYQKNGNIRVQSGDIFIYVE